MTDEAMRAELAITDAARVLAGMGEWYNDDDLAIDIGNAIADAIGYERLANVGWSIAIRSGLAYRPRILALAGRDGSWRCHYCGESFSADRPPVVEHVIPKVRGGSNDHDNLVLACALCNGRKGTATPLEWLGEACCDEHEATR